jgi:hypothetical protein
MAINCSAPVRDVVVSEEPSSNLRKVVTISSEKMPCNSPWRSRDTVTGWAVRAGRRAQAEQQGHQQAIAASAWLSQLGRPSG